MINTSENRTLDSDRLFDLAGYNKIRWMNCPLNEVSQCAQYIFEKQNVLGADKFRIAVLIDFYNFDRVRVPYGRRGYRPEEGVDISLYLPFIEIYLLDNLITFLEYRDLHAADFEIYYVQNTKLERYEFLSNSLTQLRQILTGDCVSSAEDSQAPEDPQLPEPMPEGENGKKTKSKKKKDGEEDGATSSDDPCSCEEEEPLLPEDLVEHSSFTLYCTKKVSLQFNLVDYPYGYETMTFPQFIKLFNERAGRKHDIRTHYYVSSYGGGQARAAFDTLTLSLHLIHMYEREENIDDIEEIEIPKINAETLKDVLVNAWNKICLARNVAKGNNSVYYSLEDNLLIDEDELAPKEQASMSFIADIQSEPIDKIDPEVLYEKICYYHDRSPDQLAADNGAVFDSLMEEYLHHRDETKEINIVNELETKMREDALVTTTQFPSEEDYLHLVSEKEKEISGRFENVLSATIREVDYTEIKERADKAYDKYMRAKAFTYRNIIGDIIFLLLTLIAFVGPYIAFQLYGTFLLPSKIAMLSLQTAGLFGAVFVLAVIIQVSVLTARLKSAKNELRECYRDCKKLEGDSLAQIRQRFQEDLIYIERARYELRQLKHLYEANLAKDANVKRHRNLLEDLEDHLSSMLNNLDVDPVLDPDDSLVGEFDITKPLRARENKIYRIFSLDTIEKLFSKKGREQL